jgi:membrane protein YdbS with pleckstrin-like domain
MHKLFESQLDNEKIYLVVRQHWLILLLKLKAVLLMFILGIALWWYVPELGSEFLSDEALRAFTVLMYIYFFGLLLGSLMVITYYYLHMQIVTGMRMVDVDQLGLFKRNVSEIQLENVEEVTSKSHGVLATVFNFGNVTVQTSGSQIEFEFENVAHPEHIKKLILDLYEKRHKEYNQKSVV